MSKSLMNQKKVFKITSTMLRDSNWDLKLTRDEANLLGCIISLGDSDSLRKINIINSINKNKTTEDDINNKKEEIKKLKKLKNSDENIEKLKILQKELENMIFVEDYLPIVFDSTSDWNRANSVKNPLKFNGKEYVRLIGTTGGVKNSTVVFVNKGIHSELDRMLNNGRNEKEEYIPAKFEAYKALSCSASTPVTIPEGRKVLVIKDGEVEFEEEVIQLIGKKIDINRKQQLMGKKIKDLTESEVDERNKLIMAESQFDMNNIKNYRITRAFTDGCGMISEGLSNHWAKELGVNYTPSGFNTRNAFNKGMVFTFPFHEFADEVVEGGEDKYLVEDAWGEYHDIRDVDLILTTNMLKLWKAYSSISDYLTKCEENNFQFSITKVLPEKLENTRNMNYQFLQSYDLSDDDIKELIKDTVDNIKGATHEDYVKMLLFLKGNTVTEKKYNDEEFNYIKALMINKDMMNDPFIKQRVLRMMEKKINDAKKGVIQVEGNYSIVSGDLYALCQHMFKIKPTGLLKKGEFYSNTWNEKNANKVVAFRAPMTIHNNIRVFNLVNNEVVNKWFRFMKTCTVLNAWDTTMDAMNGMDLDGDAVITTNNEVLLRNTRELPAIVCEQQISKKEKISKVNLRNANKNGFGCEVGSITNRCTSMFDVLSKFEKGSAEYDEMIYRIMCMQAYQQECLDSIKGIAAKEVPNYWYKNKSVSKLFTGDEKELNMNLCSSKKPYFFIYNYKQIMSKYRKYQKDNNSNCLVRFGLTIDELKQKADKTEEEIEFLSIYDLYMPVSLEKSTMNRICWDIESELKGVKLKVKSNAFDPNLLKSKTPVRKDEFNKIKSVYNECKGEYKNTLGSKLTKEDRNKNRSNFISRLSERLFEACNNEDVLTNALIDICYKNDESKQLVWDICGDIILKNLLDKAENKINTVVEINEDVDSCEKTYWCGKYYSVVASKIKKDGE